MCLVAGTLFYLSPSAAARFSAGERVHRRLVLTDRDDEDRAVVVPFNTFDPLRQGQGNLGYAPVLLQQGEHPFITRATILNLEWRALWNVRVGATQVDIGTLLEDDPVDVLILTRLLTESIATGALDPHETGLAELTLARLAGN